MAGMLVRAALAGALAAAGLSACAGADGYAVRAERAVQQDVIGDVVRVGATFCVDGDDDGACAGDGAAAVPRGVIAHAGIQLFAAFLVPAGTTAPAGAQAGLPEALGGAKATLVRDASIDATLQDTRPAPAGLRWVGYRSPVLGAGPDPGAGWTAAADFTIARGPGGLPTPATFAHAVLGGVRLAYPAAVWAPGAADPGAAAPGSPLFDSRPVDCDERGDEPFPTTLCGGPSPTATLPLTDLRGAGGAVRVAPGGTVRVPFTLRYAGVAGPAFALRASTAVPGASAEAAPATLTPGAAGFEDAAVTVAVPAAAPPGIYAVTLTAAVGGQTRIALGTVTVTGAASPAPVEAAGLEPDGEPRDDGEDPDRDAGAAGAGAAGARRPARLVEFVGVARSGLAADGRTVTLGDVLCHKPGGFCGTVRARLVARFGGRMVTLATVAGAVPAGERRRIRLALGPRASQALRAGAVLSAVVSVRASPAAAALVHRTTLRAG